MKTLTLWLSLYLTALLTRAADPVSPEEPKLHLRIHRAATLSNPGMAAVERGQMKHFVLNLEYKDAKACNLARDSFSDEKSAVHTVAWYDRFATVLIPAEEKQLKASLELLDNSVGLLWCEGVGAVTPPEPPPLPDAALTGKAVAEGILHGGMKIGDRTLTGRGVIVAIVDSGCDFRHPDFIRTVDVRKESRFLAIWDTLRPHQAGIGKPGR